MKTYFTHFSLKRKCNHVFERINKWILPCLFKICPSWALQGVNCVALTAHVIRSMIVSCSKQLGCELLLAGVYSSIRHCEWMTSDTSSRAVALLQSHNLQHKSCVLVCWATKCLRNLISLSQAVTLIRVASLSLCGHNTAFPIHLTVKEKHIYLNVSLVLWCNLSLWNSLYCALFKAYTL